MAKKRRKKGINKKGSRRFQRGYQYNTRLDKLLKSPYLRNIFAEKPLHKRIKLKEDLREWRPKLQDLRKLDGTPVEYRLSRYRKKPYRRLGLEAKLAFDEPLKVNVCVKRKRRRETLFKLRRIGKGKGVSKKRIMKPESKVRC